MKLHLSYFSDKTKLTVNRDTVDVKAFQIMLWVSIGDSDEWDPRLPKTPAILDVGNTHNFAIAPHHLNRWAGLHADSLPLLRTVRESGRPGQLKRAGLWLHMDNEPYSLMVHEGIAVMDENDWPRLPILGLRALTNSNLQVHIYGDTKRAVIRTPPPWYWPF